MKETYEGDVSQLLNPNLLHTFELSTNRFDIPNEYHQEIMNQMQRMPRINFIFGVKHENAGKIESHLWFFRGLCNYIKPKYT